MLRKPRMPWLVALIMLGVATGAFASDVASTPEASLERLAKSSRHTTIAAAGQNLLDGQHAEASGALIPRTVQARMTVSIGR